MRQQESTERLKDEIEELLNTINGAPGLCDLAREALAKKRRGLDSGIEYDRPWVLLPMMISEAVCGTGERALPAATSLQFLLAAGDVFDDIEDADSDDSLCAKYGLAQATNVASTLLILGERSLTRLKLRAVDNDIILRAVDTVNSFYTAACAGQHLDLQTDVQQMVTEETYLNTIAMKSAAQIECACSIGAIVAGASQELIDAFASLGRNLGMASQISNDIQGVVSGRDILNRKITLPIIYALNLPESEIHNELSQAFIKRDKTVNDAGAIKTLLFQTGAVQYATVKMDVYNQKAKDILFNIQSFGANVEKLKVFFYEPSSEPHPR